MSETFEEWGVREDGAAILVPGDGTEDEARAEKVWFETRMPPIPVALVRRTVTHSSWEEVTDR